LSSKIKVCLHCVITLWIYASDATKHVKIFDLLQSHSRFNRQSFPEIEQHIEAVWSDRVAKQPWLFNGAKFRLHSAVLSVIEKGPMQSCVLTLQLGLTCYKDYLGTNWSREAGRLQSHGQNECADPQAFLAQPLGVGAVVATADGDVVLLRRSQKVAEAAGLLDIPGGHPEPKVRSKRAALHQDPDLNQMIRDT
uniref:Nudix (nucleoside diphosphate linked moiety X)-type motif 22 n=1 Tax=Cyprinus carpio TaxID=7962 RepID=A0A8C1ZV62_CYPCA